MKRYGITETKKAELDGSIVRVADAQSEVQRLQGIVDAIPVNSSDAKITHQVNEATADLERAQLKLRSEQAGLAAATAAALAS